MRTGVRDIMYITNIHSNEMGYFHGRIYEKIGAIKWHRGKSKIGA